nr:reverse transcriptase domain-containing protein [Tanacetum cinerariifolium]
MKAVTTRSGLAYEGPSIPAESPLEKVDEQNTEEILDKEHSNSSRSTAQVQPLVVPILILEPDVPRTQPKPSIPYPSREVLLENRSCFNRCIWRGNYPQDFVQDVLDFQYNPKSSNPTLVSDDSISENDSCKVPILRSSSLTLTLFGESDFIIKEIEDFLNDDLIPDGIDNSVFDPEGDIRLIEKLLNADPCSLPLMDLKLAEESKVKSSVEEPPELELKDFPSHLEYAFLEDSNKFPVIIAKNLKVDEREALLNVLKSHKRAIVWKISDIKGIDPRFYTHKS